MERKILQALNFDINIPVPYRFLRRYAKVGGCEALIMSCFIIYMNYCLVIMLIIIHTAGTPVMKRDEACDSVYTRMLNSL